MRYPVELAWGNFHLPVHLLCEVLAYSLGYRFYTILRARTADRISDHGRQWIFVGAATGALLGSRLLGLLEHPALLLHPPGGWLYYTTNKTIVGGFLGGLVGVELTKKRLGIRASSGDLMVFPLALGLAIGRLGCHFSGLEDGTFGTATRLPWGIDFGDGIRRHPTNLYEITFLALLAGLLWLRERRRPLPEGRRFELFLSAYLLFRLLIEFLKPTVALPGLGLTAIQWACVAGLGYYVWGWWRQGTREASAALEVH
ncbi:prolipoprotein diacylglyceryl transferase [Hymenobacter baengnokdamensis]|uniref:prolipoprotein diacylglyceryl transferase n=1 Tax=Hymenobacter baengnokdamensis TaxID=2615203 RepID=UPI00124514AB|nr:prolipoprotein diacylglyceryl transferase family protein [Hymenobacter baengnokdamensis]